MDILDDMGVSKLSATVFKKKVNYSFKNLCFKKLSVYIIQYLHYEMGGLSQQ